MRLTRGLTAASDALACQDPIFVAGSPFAIKMMHQALSWQGQEDRSTVDFCGIVSISLHYLSFNFNKTFQNDMEELQ